jgi:hypothetical protein
VLLLVSIAFGAPCPWTEKLQTVRSVRTWVQINEQNHPVAGRPAWEALHTDMRACGMYAAAEALYKWRKTRRITNTVAIVGAATFWGMAAVPIPALAAGRWRRTMNDELIAWEPFLPAPVPVPVPVVDLDCRSDCCRICDVGQACGDSCISAEFACTAPRGCACSAQDVCSVSEPREMETVIIGAE